MNKPIPLRPDYGHAHRAAANDFWRAVTSATLHIITRGAATPTDTASGLATIGATGLTVLAPQSAFARLAARCARVEFADANQILIPFVDTSPVPLFVGEGGPHQIVQSVLGTLTFGPPKKILFGAVVTAELDRYAIETATTIVQKALTIPANTAVDGAAFDAAAADFNTTRRFAEWRFRFGRHCRRRGCCADCRFSKHWG